MREVWLDHSEVLNSTEIILIFKTKFDRREYATYTVINLATNTKIQDECIFDCIEKLSTMDRSVARNSEKIE